MQIADEILLDDIIEGRKEKGLSLEVFFEDPPEFIDFTVLSEYKMYVSPEELLEKEQEKEREEERLEKQR